MAIVFPTTGSFLIPMNISHALKKLISSLLSFELE